MNSCEDKLHFKFICNICGNGFDSERAIKIHLSQAHMSDNVKKYPCDKCTIKCSRLETLKLHKLSMHEERAHSCSHCDFKTYTQHKLKGHLKIKHNEGDRKSIQCGTCDFKCLYTHELVDHIRFKHTRDPLLCFICDANYLDRKALRDHMKKHGRKLAKISNF